MTHLPHYIFIHQNYQLITSMNIFSFQLDLETEWFSLRILIFNISFII